MWQKEEKEKLLSAILYIYRRMELLMKNMQTVKHAGLDTKNRLVKEEMIVDIGKNEERK